jgi:5'-nucleotidase
MCCFWRIQIVTSISKILFILLPFSAGIVAGYGFSIFPHSGNIKANITHADQDELFQPRLVQFAESNASATKLMGHIRDLYLRQNQETIAYLSQTLCHRAAPGLPQPEIEMHGPCTTRGQYGSELVQKLTASLYAIHPEADIVLQNAGAGRAPLKAGPLTDALIRQAFPFKNELVLIKLRGQDLKTGLEKVLQTYQVQSLRGAYPYASGLRFHVDATQPEGSRLTHIEFKDRKTNQWEPLAMDRVYQVLTNDFLAQGKDGYQMFAGLERQTPPSNIGLQQSLIAHLQTAKQVAPLEPDDYSTQSFKN